MKGFRIGNAMTLAWVLFFLAVLTGSLSGQSGSARILGVVADPSGGVIPGASVTVVNQGTGIKWTAATDGEGRYEVLALPVGTYSITADATGLKTVAFNNLVLETQQSREINFTLVTAMVQQSVTVEGSAVEVERSDAAIDQIIHSEQVAKLPLNGRDFVQLGTLAPGAAQGTTGFFNNRGQGEVAIRGSIDLAVAGMRENDNDWLYDGVDNNELTAGAISILPSIDAIQEFKVLSFNYSAQYGARGGATVLVTTKSGTNTFHGNVFEFIRNDKLDARNYFDGPVKPVYIQNQYGGTFGGPIRKDKTFFFLSYEGERVHQALTILSTVPTRLQKEGIFTESFPGSPAPIIYDPSTTTINPVTNVMSRTPFANNTITHIDPIAQQLINLYPDPTFTDRRANNYLSNPIRTMSDDAGIARIDHQFSQKDSLFGRFTMDDANEYYPGGLPGFAAGGSPSTFNTFFSTNAANLALSETHTFNANTINILSAGYNRDFNRFHVFGYGSNESQALGIPGANLGNVETSQLVSMSFNGGFQSLGGRAFSPYQGGTNVFHYSDTLTHVHGAHTFTTGFYTRIMQMNTLGNMWLSGNFTFDNNFTAQINPAGGFVSTSGSSMASLLLGLPATRVHSYQFNGYTMGRRWQEYRGFFQDDWRASHNLTLNFGLAYDVTTPVTEAHGRMANFDPSTNTLLIPGQNAGNSAGVSTDYSDIQPRFGFAWSPKNSSKTAVRGGYGIFYDDGVIGGTQGLYQNPPFAGDVTYTSDDLNTGVTIDNGFPIVPSIPGLAGFGGNLVIQQKDFKQGMVQQWNLNVQQELPGKTIFSIAYAGTRGSHLQEKGFNTNTATPGPGVNPAARRPFPQYNNFDFITSRGILRYDALLLRGEKSMNNGLYFLASYTYSKAFTNGLSQQLATNSALVGIDYYPLNVFPKEDKGLSATDLTHNFSFSGLYQLPFGSGRKWLSNSNGFVTAIVSGWDTSLIEHLRTGFPMFFTVSSNQSGTQLGNRPLITCNAQLPRNQQTATRFFNTSCFAAPPAGTLAITSRSAFRGPSQANTDFAVQRIFSLGRLREASNLEFRAEMFNIFNTAQFDQPDQGFGDATFGHIPDTINSSRQIQFAIKINF
jgi:hypothetical protein